MRISYIIKCKRLLILRRDRHLEGSKTATLYIDLQITVPISVTYYPIISPPSSCIYRASRATFTIKSFIQFFHTAKLTVMGPDRTTCWPINWIALPVAPSIYYLIQEVTTSTTFASVLSFFIYQTNGRPTLVDERIQPTNELTNQIGVAARQGHGKTRRGHKVQRGRAGCSSQGSRKSWTGSPMGVGESWTGSPMECREKVGVATLLAIQNARISSHNLP